MLSAAMLENMTEGGGAKGGAYAYEYTGVKGRGAGEDSSGSSGGRQMGSGGAADASTVGLPDTPLPLPFLPFLRGVGVGADALMAMPSATSVVLSLTFTGDTDRVSSSDDERRTGGGRSSGSSCGKGGCGDIQRTKQI